MSESKDIYLRVLQFINEGKKHLEVFSEDPYRLEDDFCAWYETMDPSEKKIKRDSGYTGSSCCYYYRYRPRTEALLIAYMQRQDIRLVVIRALENYLRSPFIQKEEVQKGADVLESLKRW